MKRTTKLVGILSIFIFLLIACSNETSNENGNNDVNAEENETLETEVETNLELIPFDELAILKNEPKLYEGRPFENVPVEVISVERYSDRVVIEASLYETGSDHYFTIVQLGSSETDINTKDALYFDGVVRNEIDTKKSFPSSATKVELTNYQKVEFADLLDPVLTSKQINMSLENELVSIDLHKVDVGEKYTRVYYTETKKDDEYSGNIEAVLITSEGELDELNKSEASKISIK